MFPPYTSAPPRSRDGSLRCCISTKSRRFQWPVPYRRVIYRRTIRRSLAVKLKLYFRTRCSPPLVTQNCNPLKIQSPLIPDFPAFLPEISARIDKLRSTNDYASINNLLASVNSLFMKFRDGSYNNYDLFVDSNYCLDNFGKALFELFKQTGRLIDDGIVEGAAINASILILYIESQRLCCSILYSLSFNELPRFLKKHMSEWMVEFNKYITLRVSDPPEREGGVVALAELRAAVCDNLTLYVIKEELLLGCFVDLAPAVLDLLVYSSSPQGRCRERLCVTVSTIKFLTAVSKTSHHVLLSKDVIFERIRQSIIVPHLMLRDDEEELFEINPIEFIRKDLEGSHIDPLKRIACELLEGIAIHYKRNVERGLFKSIDSCFGRFSDSDPKANWKYIYCSFCLAISLATKNAAAAAAGTSVSPDILNVESFFVDFIFYKLKHHGLDITSFPMIQAVILKFIILFRNQLSKHNELLVILLPYVTRLLTSPHYVVYSYAARCIEELFSVKVDTQWFWIYSSRILWLSKAGYTLSTLVSNLFGALCNPGSAENLYVMKCIMRVVLVGDLTVDVASLCIEGLTTILHRVFQNPRNVLFNHYLFESLTGLIRRVCFLSNQVNVNERPSKEEISLASLLERKLYPCLQYILARDISELFTYAFRLLLELVDLNRPLLPAEYRSQVFDILQLPDSWVNQAKGFLPPQLNFPSVVYSKLVLSSAIKDNGYYVLDTVIENLGFEVISPFVSEIWVSLFNRLQNQRTEKSVRNIIVFISLFLLKDDPRNIVSSVNTAVQPNAFQAILEQFWIPNLKLIENPIELKLATIASTRLMSESPDIFDTKLRGKMLDCIATLISRTMDDEPQVQGVGLYCNFCS